MGERRQSGIMVGYDLNISKNYLRFITTVQSAILKVIIITLSIPQTKHPTFMKRVFYGCHFSFNARVDWHWDRVVSKRAFPFMHICLYTVGIKIWLWPFRAFVIVTYESHKTRSLEDVLYYLSFFLHFKFQPNQLEK